MAILRTEKELWRDIRDREDTVLLEGEYEGERVVFACTMTGNDDYISLSPKAVILTDEMLSKCSLDGDPLSP